MITGIADMRVCGVDCDAVSAVNIIPPCGVTVISNSSVCTVCVFHANYGVW